MKNIKKINLGQILRKRRSELGFTQNELADLVGLETSQYQKYEYNICRPNFENTLKIFFFLQISVDKIGDEFIENNVTNNHKIESISRELKYSKFIRNNFLLDKKDK